jgi:phosphate uptake regulator
MLSRIVQLWRGKSLIGQMVGEFMEMLELSKSMFDSMTSVGLSGGNLEAIRDEFFAKDQAINRLEQSVRREILVHLSVQEGADVTACLILMNASKDAERLGDYTKNIFEVLKDTPTLEPGLYYDQLLKLSDEISSGFTRVGNVFKEADVQAARELKESNYRLEKQCDAVIHDLMSGAECETPVAYALLFRFHKRILAHLSNIVSSVVMPVDKIGYFEATDQASEET